jgi:hypothetical protein
MKRVLVLIWVLHLSLWAQPEQRPQKAFPYNIDAHYEFGIMFTDYDSQLDLDDSAGLWTTLHLRLWDENFMTLTYRFADSDDEIAGGDVDIHAYMIGIRHEEFLSPPMNNIGISAGIALGLERFSGTEPQDTGPMLSLDLTGRYQVTDNIAFRLGFVYDIVNTSANQRDGTEMMNNFSLAISFYWSF